jgi:serine/threonine-protein kinase
MSLPAIDFVRLLAEHRVLDTGSIEDLQPLLRQSPDAESFSRRLIEGGWLTAYQVERVLCGEAASLLFGDYRLIEPLGQGGMGHVFKAAHLRLGRVVALKMIRPQSLTSTENPDELIRRFQREAQAAAQLLHPNVVILFDYNECGGIHFIAMEYVDGVDLARMVQTQGPLPIPHACAYLRQAAGGLQHAFEYGIVHRDIKPSNLLVTRAGGTRPQRSLLKQRSSGKIDLGAVRSQIQRSQTGGVVKILDLGLVRFSEAADESDTLSALTMQGTIIGTPDYIAPEQARDASRVDIRADIYSLGCTFYFMLTGRAPFPGGTSVEKLFRHQNESAMPVEQIRPGTPKDVIAVVQRMMAKNPESRYQTPAELAAALAELPADLTAGRSLPELSVTAAVRADPSPTPPSGETRLFAADSLVLPARKLASLHGHKGYVTALDFSPDGRLLASGSVEGLVRLWEVGLSRVGEKALDQNSDLGEVTHLCFGGTGKTLLAATAGIGSACWRWDWVGLNKNIRGKFPSGGYRCGTLAASPDGKLLAAGSSAAVLVYDLDTNRRPWAYKGHRGDVRALVWSADGKRLYSAGQDGAIILWEPGRYWHAQRASFEGHGDAVNALAVTPDGSLVASGSADSTIRLWDASGATAECVAVLRGHAGNVRRLRFTAQGALLLSVGDGGSIFLWEVTEQRRVREWQVEKSLLHSVAISHDGRFVALGHGDNQVACYDLELIEAPLPTPQLQGA